MEGHNRSTSLDCHHVLCIQISVKALLGQGSFSKGCFRYTAVSSKEEKWKRPFYLSHFFAISVRIEKLV